mgnify:CR=1 FL=1
MRKSILHLVFGTLGLLLSIVLCFYFEAHPSVCIGLAVFSLLTISDGLNNFPED